MDCPKCKRPRWDGQSDQSGFCPVGDCSLATPVEVALALKDCEISTLCSEVAKLRSGYAEIRAMLTPWSDAEVRKQLAQCYRIASDALWDEE